MTERAPQSSPEGGLSHGESREPAGGVSLKRNASPDDADRHFQSAEMPPLALYIHWPFCKKKCPYCDFNSHVRDAVDQTRYRNALLTELRTMHALAPHHTLTSIFFGGGTPSLMPPETAHALIEEAKRLWPTSFTPSPIGGGLGWGRQEAPPSPLAASLPPSPLKGEERTPQGTSLSRNRGDAQRGGGEQTILSHATACAEPVRLSPEALAKEEGRGERRARGGEPPVCALRTPQPIEITLEANPTSVEAATFPAFREAGVNRVSLGIQSLRAESLAFLGREHSAREALRALDHARTHFSRYSFDLIYALPNQSLAAWEAELSEALRHAGSHLSLYQLTIEPNTAFHHSYHVKRAFDLPPEALAADLYALTQSLMASAGLPAYEISNHAAPGEESRHNLSYWRGHAYIGIGPGAHGRIPSHPLMESPLGATAPTRSGGVNAEREGASPLFATGKPQPTLLATLTSTPPPLTDGPQTLRASTTPPPAGGPRALLAPTAPPPAGGRMGGGQHTPCPSKPAPLLPSPLRGEELLATLTYKTPERWLEQVEAHGHGLESAEPLTPEERLEERLMTGLRLTEGLALSSLTETEHTLLNTRIPPRALTTLRDAGMLETTPTHWRTTPQGKLVLNSILQTLLA